MKSMILTIYALSVHTLQKIFISYFSVSNRSLSCDSP